MGGENPTQCAGDSSLGQRPRSNPTRTYVHTMECDRPFWSASCQHVAAFSSSSPSLFASTRTRTAVYRLMRRRPRLRPQGLSDRCFPEAQS